MAFVLAAPAPTLNHEETTDLSVSPLDDMKSRPKLEILLDQSTLFLKGTGVDVEPTLLSGRVALYLAESCSIREITLQFRGKAHCSGYDSTSVTTSTLSYVVCDHEWSFLEGEKKHNHTLKAGRHYFPFQLQLGGSLPSSISTRSMGGSSVLYKLKAHVVRSGLSHNLQTTVPLSIVRSFSAEALEYQQSLEIENTWPGKLMYSLMIPHKAWAAGDTLTSVFKYDPLAKGVTVLSVSTSIHETVKVFGRSNMEQTRIVASVKHDLCEGKAVEVSRTPSTPGSSGTRTPATPFDSRGTSPGGYFTLIPYQTSVPSSSSSAMADPQEVEPAPTTQDDDEQDGSATALLTLDIPSYLTPTHSLDPITVSHRIRWNILILNLDGHTSELRCSLPLCILDKCLLDESRSFSAQTRRLLLGRPEVSAPAEDDMELPSYSLHIRDRIANQYLSDSATMRVTNPWVVSSVSPVVVDNRDAAYPWPRTASGNSTPLEAHLLSHLPSNPRSGDNRPLDWVNSELLLSLTGEPPVLSPESRVSPPPQASESNSQLHSHRSSRSSSPERAHHRHITGPNATYLHSASHASRNLQSLFKASMKPLSSMSNPLRLSSRSHSHSSIPTLASLSMSSTSGNSSIQFSDPNSGSALLHRAFTEVPNYELAARGFIGGVTPLSSMAGLPSYAEASQNSTSSDSSPTSTPPS